MICGDGGRGLLAALPIVFPEIPVQRCWAHKIRNVLNKVRKANHAAVKRALHRIMNAANAPAARAGARRFADRRSDAYPSAVACLRNALDELSTCFRYTPEARRKAVRTTNVIERRFREVRRRTPGPWAPSRTRPPWTASSSPCSPTKTNHRASAPLSC
jgi:putative transposase